MTGIYILALLAFVSGLKVTEVAHDFHAGVRKYVTEDLGLLNSYDTWHGNIASMLLSLQFSMSEMNNVVKAMKKVGQGAAKEEGKTWFIQLKDKRKQIELSCNILLYISTFL